VGGILLVISCRFLRDHLISHFSVQYAALVLCFISCRYSIHSFSGEDFKRILE
jgi:hypothetical protein